jgi:hypothetical protein
MYTIFIHLHGAKLKISRNTVPVPHFLIEEEHLILPVL